MSYLFFFAAILSLQDDFELLEGKKTPRWVHLQTEADFSSLEKYKSLYEKNRSLQFNPPLEYKIPKVVHFIWLGPKNFPMGSIKNVRTWLAKHPDWTFKFWTDRDRPPPCEGMQVMKVQDFSFKKLKNYYNLATNWAEKANILAYEILAEEGGVYADHDANALQPFDPLNRAYDFYGCLETPQKRISGFALTLGIGLIGARAHHPILERCLDVIARRWDEVYSLYGQNEIHHEVSRVMNGTYITLTFALQEALEQEGNVDIVFPASYFFSQEGLPSFYSQHFFGNSWIGKLKQNPFQTICKEKIKTLHRQIQTSTLILLIAIATFILTLFLKKRALFLLFFLLPVFSYANFEEMMGSLQEVKTPRDIALLSAYAAPFAVVKQCEHPIPKILHFIWLEEKNPSPFILRTIHDWAKKHPYWKVKVWSNHKIKRLSCFCENVKIPPLAHLQSCFDDTQNIAEKEELLIYEILWREGGVYIDTDVKCLRTLEPLNQGYSFYISLAPPHEPILGSSLTLSSAIIASIPHHPILQATMNKVQESWVKMALGFPDNDKESDLYRVLYRTHQPLDLAVQEKRGNEDMVLPALYFHRLGNQEPLFAEHLYHCSWIKEEESFETKVTNELDRLARKLQFQKWLYALLFVGILVTTFKRIYL